MNYVREEEGNLGFAILLVVLVVVLSLIVMGLDSTKTHEKMDEAANMKAFCDSIGGNYGGCKCYKDGKEITNEGATD